MKWNFISDNLNTHMSASLVRYVAEESDIASDLGVKGESGILKSKASRLPFGATHPIALFFISQVMMSKMGKGRGWGFCFPPEILTDTPSKIAA